MKNTTTSAWPQDQRLASLRADEIEAHRRTFKLAASSAQVDRQGWTEGQWIADAERLMSEIDGSAACLLNGHVMALQSRLARVRTFFDGLADTDADRLADLDVVALVEDLGRVVWPEEFHLSATAGAGA